MLKGIFLLTTKQVNGKTFCIGVHRMGTPGMEFIVGELDTGDREYRKGDEVGYIYRAEYFDELKKAWAYFDRAG